VFVCVCIYIDLGYGAMYSVECSRAMDQFFIIKMQMVDPTV
jgi:hypothetical protein